MIAAACQCNETDVALEHDRFGARGNSEQAEPRGEFAFVHDAVAGEIGILGVMYDESVEVARRK